MQDGGDNVFRRHRLAIVEGCSFPYLEGPFLGAIGGLVAFGNIADDVAICIDLGEAVGQGAPERCAGELVRIEAGVHRVRRRAVADADLEGAAFLWLGAGGASKHCVGGGQRHAGGQRQLREFAPRDASARGCRQRCLQFVLSVVHTLRLPDPAARHFLVPIVRAQIMLQSILIKSKSFPLVCLWMSH